MHTNMPIFPEPNPNNHVLMPTFDAWHILIEYVQRSVYHPNNLPTNMMWPIVFLPLCDGPIEAVR